MPKMKTVFLSIFIIISVTLYLVPTVSSQSGTSVAVHFIDVGQGDSIFIDTPNRDVLIDGGSASASHKVLDYLRSLNIARIYLVIATHAHEDHIGGLVDLLNSKTTIEQVLFNNQNHTSATYNNFITLVKTHNLTVAQHDQTYILSENTTLVVINPTQPLEFSDQNDNSIVVKLQVKNKSFLFTGDAEENAEHSMLLRSSVDLDCDVLKVGHHGSYTATCQEFLDLIDPDYAVISAGIENRYGHPHNVTLERLAVNNVTTFCTTTSGTIIAHTDGTTISFPRNPQSIPELSQNVYFLAFTATTLISTIVYAKNYRKYSIN